MNRDQYDVGLHSVGFTTKEAAEAYLSTIAASVSKVTFSGSEQSFHIDYAGGSIGHCALHRGSHSGVSFSVADSDEMHLLIPLKSGLEFHDRRGVVDARSQRTGLLLPPSATGRVVAAGSFAGISLIASAKAVRDHARKLIDPHKELSADLGNVRAANFSDPVIEALSRNMISAFHELVTLGQSGLNAVVGAQFDETLLGLLALATSCGLKSLLGTSGSEPGAAIVRRAQEYIRAHSDQPIRMAELAESLGVGMRSLQLAFQRHVGCSPRDFLLRCRLDRARASLLIAEPNAKVATVALDCGFGDLAHFSRTYRDAFGELPSVTLRNRRS